MPVLDHDMSGAALGNVLKGTYDYRLVVLSFLIAMFAAYAALDLSGRVTASRGRLRGLWLSGGAAAMGVGIWSMHYIGMLAYSLPVTVYYDWHVVGLSLLAAVFASAIALFVASRDEMGALRAGGGCLAMGSAIATMHYTGMEAMRLSAMCHYSTGLVLLSVLAGIVISVVALQLTFRLRAEGKTSAWQKPASALLMGAAIPVMHYTGMAAVTFTPMPMAADLTHAVEISSLGVFCIGGGALTILALTILTSLFDRRFSAQTLELERSEQSYRQLVESVKVILWRGNVDISSFSYINHEAEDLLGYPAKAWTGTPGFWLERMHPDDRELTESCCRAAAEGRGRGYQRFEHRITAAGGNIVWLSAWVRRVVHEDGTRELVGVMADVTQRRQAQDEVKRLNALLAQENTRMSAELEVTQQLQQMMLPRDEDMRGVSGLDISGYMEPADEVGGDYYDVVAKDGGVFFGIGDVTGHGLKSGVIAIMVQTAVRTLLASGRYNSRHFFEVLNRVIFDNARRMNCEGNLTFCLLRYEQNLVTVSGQHEEVIVVRNDGAIERHDTLDLGFPLGLEEDIGGFLNEASFPLGAGDVMVVYTDGITEAINRAGFAYGLERLSEAVKANRAQPSEAIRKAVLGSLQEYTGGIQLQDDVSLLIIKPAEVGCT